MANLTEASRILKSKLEARFESKHVFDVGVVTGENLDHQGRIMSHNVALRGGATVRVPASLGGVSAGARVKLRVVGGSVNPSYELATVDYAPLGGALNPGGFLSTPSFVMVDGSFPQTVTINPVTGEKVCTVHIVIEMIPEHLARQNTKYRVDVRLLDSQNSTQSFETEFSERVAARKIQSTNSQIIAINEDPYDFRFPASCGCLQMGGERILYGKLLGASGMVSGDVPPAPIVEDVKPDFLIQMDEDDLIDYYEVRISDAESIFGQAPYVESRGDSFLIDWDGDDGQYEVIICTSEPVVLSNIIRGFQGTPDEDDVDFLLLVSTSVQAGLQINRVYEARVTAITTDGRKSNPSKPVVFTTRHDVVAPPAPRWCMQSTQMYGIAVTWGNASSLDLLYYEVQQSADGTTWGESHKTGKTTYKMFSHSNQPMSYRVRSVDEARNASYWRYSE